MVLTWNDSPSLDVTSWIHSPGLGMSRSHHCTTTGMVWTRTPPKHLFFVLGCSPGCGHLGILSASRGSHGVLEGPSVSCWVHIGVLCRLWPTSLPGQALITQTKHLMGQGRGEETPKHHVPSSSGRLKEEPRGVQCSSPIYGQPGGRAAATNPNLRYISIQLPSGGA